MLYNYIGYFEAQPQGFCSEQSQGSQVQFSHSQFGFVHELSVMFYSSLEMKGGTG